MKRLLLTELGSVLSDASFSDRILNLCLNFLNSKMKLNQSDFSTVKVRHLPVGKLASDENESRVVLSERAVRHEDGERRSSVLRSSFHRMSLFSALPLELVLCASVIMSDQVKATGREADVDEEQNGCSPPRHVASRKTDAMFDCECEFFCFFTT
ncbi:uncharacterized protein V6R79_016429 [Siganus canaliculatus]